MSVRTGSGVRAVCRQSRPRPSGDEGCRNGVSHPADKTASGTNHETPCLMSGDPFMCDEVIGEAPHLHRLWCRHQTGGQLLVPRPGQVPPQDPTRDLVHVKLHNEGNLVHRFDDTIGLAAVDPVEDHMNDLHVVLHAPAAVPPGALVDRDAGAHFIEKLLLDQARFLGDDHQTDVILKALKDKVDHLPGDNEGQDRIKRHLQGKDQGRDTEEDCVEEQDDRTDRNAEAVVEVNPQDLGSIQDSAVLDRQADPGTQTDPAKDGDQQFVVRHRTEVLESG